MAPEKALLLPSITFSTNTLVLTAAGEAPKPKPPLEAFGSSLTGDAAAGVPKIKPLVEALGASTPLAAPNTGRAALAKPNTFAVLVFSFFAAPAPAPKTGGAALAIGGWPALSFLTTAAAPKTGGEALAIGGCPAFLAWMAFIRESTEALLTASVRVLDLLLSFAIRVSSLAGDAAAGTPKPMPPVGAFVSSLAGDAA